MKPTIESIIPWKDLYYYPQIEGHNYEWYKESIDKQLTQLFILFGNDGYEINEFLTRLVKIETKKAILAAARSTTITLEDFKNHQIDEIIPVTPSAGSIVPEFIKDPSKRDNTGEPEPDAIGFFTNPINPWIK